MRAKLALLGLAVLLAGCGSGGPKKPQPHIVKIGHAADREGDDQFKLAHVPMPNGKRLTCMMYDGYHETAISCDWGGYHGAR